MSILVNTTGAWTMAAGDSNSVAPVIVPQSFTTTGSNTGYYPPQPLTHDLAYYSRGDAPPIKLAGTFYPGQMGIPDPVVKELPRCEYCGRKQAKKDEPLCPGCGNVL